MARGFARAQGGSAEVREALRPDLERALVLTLGTSRNPMVRAAIGSRPDCPFGLMVTLAHDYSVEVRCAVASNPSAQRSVMQYLSADKSPEVVCSLIENPALAADLLEDLAFHKKSAVRAAATKRLDTGAPAVPEQHAEDERTPELADNVVLEDYAYPPAPRMDAWHEPAAPTPGAATAETPDQWSREVNSLEIPLVTAALAEAALDPHASTHGFPHGDHALHATTRTAPVRGFRPPSA